MLQRPQHTIGPDEVHVWHLLEKDLQSVVHDQLQSYLSMQEAERMNRFHQERDRALFLLSRVLMRSVLASYLQCDCRELQFGATSFGKPVLEGDIGNLHFNLTHSRGAV